MLFAWPLPLPLHPLCDQDKWQQSLPEWTTTTGETGDVECVVTHSCIELPKLSAFLLGVHDEVKHTLSLKCGIESLIGFTLNNGFLFVASDESLALYDPTNVKSFEVIFGKTKIVQYVDSLVWVAPAKHGVNISSTRSEKKYLREA
ncbi:hypothetical protein Tco_1524518 [Tanacetum coccineum]